MKRLLRLLRDQWAWWLVPMLVVFFVATYLVLTISDETPVMPMYYDQPVAP